MPLPVLLKAVAGGGGRGMAVVDTLDGLDARVESAMREAEKAFGNGELIVERYLPRVRHIEVQVAGDGQGHAIHLFERECTLQRRHQKVIEEAPSTGLPPALRERLLADAVKLAAGVNYRGLGTVEFVVSGDEHHFLEVNPRLQVEHPVTEEVTGLDLVELQLRIADTGRLPLTQADVRCEGHAFEARLCAEDAEAGFLPTTGRLDRVDFSRAAVRIESGVESGDEISPYYDSMIAKLVSRGPNREAARRALAAGLRDSTVIGLTTNLQFLHELLHWPQTIAATFHTRLIDESFAADAATTRAAPVVPPEHVAAAALHWLAAQRAATPELGCWSQAQGFTGWRLANGGPAPAPLPNLVLKSGTDEWPVRFGAPQADGSIELVLGDAPERASLAVLPSGHRLLHFGGRTLELALVGDCAQHRAVEPARAQRVRLHALPRRCARRRHCGRPARRTDDGQGGGPQGRGGRCGEDRPDGGRARVDEDGAARHRPVRRQRGRCALQGRRHGRAPPGVGRGGAGRAGRTGRIICTSKEQPMTSFPKQVEFHEEGPREGFQMEKATYPLADRLALIDALAAAGLKQVQCASFVSPRAVPQMADSPELFAQLKKRQGTRYTALWLNDNGFERARACEQVDLDGKIVFYVTEPFSQRNNNCSVAENRERQLGWIDRYIALGIPLEQAYVVTSFGCNLGGPVPVSAITDIVRWLADVCADSPHPVPGLLPGRHHGLGQPGRDQAPRRRGARDRAPGAHRPAPARYARPRRGQRLCGAADGRGVVRQLGVRPGRLPLRRAQDRLCSRQRLHRGHGVHV
jgi:hypothetical protein